MPANPDPRRELATLETCDTYLEFGVCTCWPKCVPSAPAAPLDTPGAQAWHAQLDFERSVGELRAAAAAVSDEQLAKLPELERRLITETRAHLAEYDRAKRGEGADG
jgi:hypothetical protein